MTATVDHVRSSPGAGAAARTGRDAGPARGVPTSGRAGLSPDGLTVAQLRSTRRGALAVDLAAVAASLGFNLAAAPATLGGWLVGAVAPVGLFLAIALWHRAHGVLGGGLGRLFTAGLAAVAGGAGFLSFDHIRHVAVDVGGQTPVAGAVLALVVDALAVLAALVVIGAGRAIEDLQAAEAQADADRLEAERQALEAERAAEAERVERERLAQLEAEREAAELERARIEAAAEADRLAAAEVERQAEADRLEAERAETERVEAEAARERLQARGASVNASPAPGSDDRADGQGGQGGPPAPARGADTAQAIADWLLTNPDATQAEVAKGVGVSAKTVQRSPIWQAHRDARDAGQATTDNDQTTRHLEAVTS